MIKLLNKDLLLYLCKYLNLEEKLYFSTCCTNYKLDSSIDRKYIYRVKYVENINKYLSFFIIKNENNLKLDSSIIQYLEKAKKLAEIGFDGCEDDELSDS